MWINAQVIEITQDEQNGKKSKCQLFYFKKSKFDFDSNGQMTMLPLE